MFFGALRLLALLKPMKTRSLTWVCLAAGVCLFFAVGTPLRSTEGRSGRAAGATARVRPGLARSPRGGAERACQLARGGKCQEAWSLAMVLPAPQRAECLPLVSAIRAATDPAGAWRETLSIGEPALKQSCQIAVLRNGSDGCLPDLADMAGTLADESVRETMLREIVSRWALQDPSALFAWPGLASLPPAVRDEAARNLVIQGDGLNRSPAVAGAWAETIAEPELRSITMEAAAREWFAEDPEAAIEFVQRSPHLDETRRTAILCALPGQEPLPP
jgi:hypothetical protein